MEVTCALLHQGLTWSKLTWARCFVAEFGGYKKERGMKLLGKMETKNPHPPLVLIPPQDMCILQSKSMTHPKPLTGGSSQQRAAGLQSSHRTWASGRQQAHAKVCAMRLAVLQWGCFQQWVQRGLGSCGARKNYNGEMSFTRKKRASSSLV